MQWVGAAQAMRVLLFELMTSEAELSARLLPRLAAAVLSWPSALTPDPTPSAGLLGPALLAALHDLSSAALRDQVHCSFQHYALFFSSSEPLCICQCV